MSDTTKSADGTLIAVDRLGHGSPTILVHPAYGHRAFDPPMSQLAQLLSAHFSVYTYDRRGRGESGDTPPYAVEREVEDIAALIQEAGHPAFLYGMSSGAVLALEAASRGLPVKALALYEPPFIVDDSRQPYPHDYVEHLTRLVSAGHRGDAVAYAMTNAGVPEPVVAQMRNQPFWPAFEAVAHTLVYDGTIMGDTQRGRPLQPGRFKTANLPVLVVVGSRAPAWARNSAESLTRALRKGRLQMVEADFHAADAIRLAPALEDFFTTTAVPASQPAPSRS